MSIFSERLKELRKKRGYTQAELAKYMNMRQGSYTKWETGMTEPRIDSIIPLARILNTTADYLLGLTDISERNPKIKSTETIDETKLKEILKIQGDGQVDLFILKLIKNQEKDPRELFEELTKDRDPISKEFAYIDFNTAIRKLNEYGNSLGTTETK
jgi:transcriptional regulator, cro/CI family